MRQRVGAARVEQVDDLGAPAKAAEGHAAADVFTQRRQVGLDAVHRLQPAGRQAGRHHLVQQQQRADPRGRVAQRMQERGLGGDAAATAHHRLQRHHRQIGAVLLDQGDGGRGVVVGREHVLERRVDRAALAREGEDAAVVAAPEHHHLGPAGEVPREADRHQVRLGARVGEAHPLQPEAGADGPGEARLGDGVAAEVDAVVERAVDRRADDGVGVAIEARGVFAQEIDIFGAIQVPQPAPLPAREAERERVVMQHGAGIAPGHHRGRLDGAREAFRVARDIRLARLGQRRLDGGIAQGGLAHAGLRRWGDEGRQTMPARHGRASLGGRRLRFTCRESRPVMG